MCAGLLARQEGVSSIVLAWPHPADIPSVRVPPLAVSCSVVSVQGEHVCVAPQILGVLSWQVVN